VKSGWLPDAASPCQRPAHLEINGAIRAWKANTLSNTGTLDSTPNLDNTPNADSPETAHDHDHEDHNHDHEHSHGPVLNPDCTRELVIDVPAEEVAKAFSRVTGNYRRHARIPGFRAGKVPESIIRRKFSAEIRKEVVDSMLPERFNRGIAEMNVRPVGQPQVAELTLEDGSPMHAKAVFEVLPEFSIEGYQEVTVEKPSVEVTEDEFNHELEMLRDSRATIEPVEEDRPLKDGDWAEISYKGQLEGDAEAAPLIGENSLVEIGGKETVAAFSDALRGSKAGQELKAEVVYPADYSEGRLAGKTVAYEVQVKAIKKRTLPELDDDLAKELGSYESYEDLKNRVREYLVNRKRRSVENETKDRLFAALNERFQFPVPESLVQEQIDTRLERGLRALANQGMSPDQMRKLDFERLRAAQRSSAMAETKTSILLGRIAVAEKVTVTDEEVDHELQLVSYQSREPLETLKARLTQDGGLARIREQLLKEKTASLLYDRLPA
jgi:trigger factor